MSIKNNIDKMIKDISKILETSGMKDTHKVNIMNIRKCHLIKFKDDYYRYENEESKGVYNVYKAIVGDTIYFNNNNQAIEKMLVTDSFDIYSIPIKKMNPLDTILFHATKYSLSNKSKYQPYNINGNWLLPTNVYALEFDSSLKIKEISTCAELHAFEKTYKVQNPSTIAKALNWDKIKKDWDGLILYPWKGMQCIPYYNKTISEIEKKTKRLKNRLKNILKNKTRKTTNVNIDRDASYFNYNGALVSDAILGKIKLNDFISIWQRGWDEDSGIIWKNYDKVKLIRIV